MNNSINSTRTLFKTKTMDFKKIKFNRSGMTLEVLYFETMTLNDTTVTNEISKKCNMIVHNDLIEALKSLRVHFALLCDLREVNSFPVDFGDEIEKFDHETYLEKINITGISLGGEDESAGVVIIGQKELPGGGVLNIVTPFTRFDSDYSHCNTLEQAVNNLIYEAEQYLFEQKWGVKQLELPFEDFAEEDEPFGTFEDVTPVPVKKENKKRGGKKKKVEENEVLEPAY